MNTAMPPPKAVVAQALRNTLPELLADAPDDDILAKFVLENTDYERSPIVQLAA